MNFRILTLLFTGALSCLVSCDEPSTSDALRRNGSEAVKQVQEIDPIQLDEAELAQVTKDLGSYFSSMNEGRFNDYVEMVFPGVWIEDSLKEKTIAMMEDYAAKGFLNVTKDFAIKSASPLVRDSTIRVALIIAEISHEVYLGEEFRQNATQMESLIRTQYGDGQYRYVPSDNKYEIEGTAKFYAITPNDTLNFTFLNEQFAQSRYLGNILQYNTVLELKKFEGEVN